MLAVYLSHQGKGVRDIARRLEVCPATIHNWLKQEDEIVAQNKEDLSTWIFERVLIDQEIDWYD